MRAQCAGCGDPFTPARQYHRLCWVCWRERRGDTYEAGYRAGLDADRRQTPAPALTPDLLGDLVALCHPDRHPPERAELAHRATVALLAMRERVSS